MLKVDILNIMGPSMVAAVAIWAFVHGPRARILAFAAATVGLVLVTPAVRHFAPLAALPDSLEGYLRPIPNLTNFTFLPWAAFLMAGAAVGVLLDAARTATADRRLNLALLAAGLLLAWLAHEASFLPPVDPRSAYWTTSLSFFFLRLGLIVASIGVCWLWERRPTAGRRWSPLQVLGRSSLFIYWIHVEMVYGAIARPLKGAFSPAGAWVALAFFWALMLGAAVLKDATKRKFFDGKDLWSKVSRQAQPLMF
jgi:surface polysaccharide O-acyltransferase-like enzyme